MVGRRSWERLFDLAAASGAARGRFAGPRPIPQRPGLSFAFEGRTRTYRVHIPPSGRRDTARPLVLALHGGGGTGFGMARISHFSRVADRHGFLAVYPDGVDGSWADGRGVGPADLLGIDDVGFLSALLDALAAEHAIDAAGIFAAGISNGGFLAQRLASDLPGRIAAVASVGGTMPEHLAKSPPPATPVSVLFIHGTQDPMIPYEGGRVTGRSGRSSVLLSAPDSAAAWAELVGCARDPIGSVRLPLAMDDGMSVTRVTYAGALGGAEVILDIVVGGGHTWPGGIQYAPARIIGQTKRDFDASEAIWEFFKTHRRS